MSTTTRYLDELIVRSVYLDSPINRESLCIGPFSHTFELTGRPITDSLNRYSARHCVIDTVLQAMYSDDWREYR
jgi:hypothetical protein